MKRVAICIPSGDMVHADFAMSLSALAHQCGPVQWGQQKLDPIGLALVNVKDSLVVCGRNKLVEEALALGVDYLFFLDSDIAFHPMTLRLLLERDKDIVGATYIQRKSPHVLLGKALDGRALPEALQGTATVGRELLEVSGLPGGCLLVKADVFRALSERYGDLWFQTPQYWNDEAGQYLIKGEDYFFCERARMSGYQVWLDWQPSFYITHIGQSANKIPAVKMQPETNDALGR
jgi:hypothetical protein